MTEATLSYLIKDNQVLLLEKQRKIGAGLLNGVGGKMDPQDNSIIDTMIREDQEEIGITPTEYAKRADIVFHNPSDDEKDRVMHVQVFVVTKWEGTITASDEMKNPGWYDIDPNTLPFERMLPDDKHWLPLVLGGQAVKAFFRFDDDWNIVEMNMEEVDGFDLEDE